MRTYTTVMNTEQIVAMLLGSFAPSHDHNVTVTVTTEAKRPHHGERGNVTVTFAGCDALD